MSGHTVALTLGCRKGRFKHVQCRREPWRPPACPGGGLAVLVQDLELDTEQGSTRDKSLPPAPPLSSYFFAARITI